MKLGIMQPYFFPYIGYFSLIAKTDKWVVFDVSQYTPKTWMNRNRILKPCQSQDWQYIAVPLKKPSISTKIHEVEILDIQLSRNKILAQIEHYRKKAPFFNEVQEIIVNTFNDTRTNKLSTLSTKSIANVCEYLNIPFDYIVCSQSLKLPKKKMLPGDWALEISDLLNASEYINPQNGSILFEKEKFQERNIKLSFLEQADFKYDCNPYKFIENLSIIDVLMWNDPLKIKSFLYE